jgi:hypothetical protein
MFFIREQDEARDAVLCITQGFKQRDAGVMLATE